MKGYRFRIMIKRENLLQKATYLPLITIISVIFSIGLFFYSMKITVHGFKIFMPEISLVAFTLVGISSLLLSKVKIDLKYLLIILVLLGLMSLSSFLSIKPMVSFKEALRWAEILVAFFLTLHLVRRVGEVKAILTAIVLMGILQSLWGMKLLSSLPPGGRLVTPYFDNPNLLALYLDFSPLLIAGLFFAKKGLQWRIGWVYCLAIVGTSLYLTGTLGSRISNGIVIVLFSLLFFYQKTGKSIFIGILRKAVSLSFWGLTFLFFAFFLLVAFAPGLTEKLLKETEYRTANTMSARLYFYVTGYQIIEDFPLTGVGGNLYKEVAPYYVPVYTPKYYIEMLKQFHLHNLYMKITVENGILTLWVFLLFLYTVAKDMFRTLFVLKGETYWLLAGVGGSAMTWLLHNIMDEGFSFMGIQWGILLGLAVAIKEVQQIEATRDRG